MKLLIVLLFIFLSITNSFAYTETTKQYNKNDITCSASVRQMNGGIGWFYASCNDKNGATLYNTWGDNNNITYDNNGNTIDQYFYYYNRRTYVLNEQGQTIAMKSSWDGPVVETYQYTPEGKMLIFDQDGKLAGAYNDVFEYHLWNTAFSKTSPDYIDNLNQISPDGNFYEYDTNGKIKEVYYSNGEHKKFSANGDYTLYDKNGNNLGAFKSDGTKRRIYNVDEATAVVKKGAKNNFSIKYR